MYPFPLFLPSWAGYKGKFFYSVLIHSHNLIQKFYRFPLCLPCSLKIGLSGIVKRYGYLNVQEFYWIHHESYNAYVDYKEKEADWEKRYGGDNPKGYKESLYERLKNQSERTTEYRQQNADKNKGRGAR